MTDTTRAGPTGTPGWTGPRPPGSPTGARGALAAPDPALAGPVAERFAIHGEHADGLVLGLKEGHARG